MRVERDDLSGIERTVWACSYAFALGHSEADKAWEYADARIERMRDEAQRRELLRPQCTGLAASWCPVCGDCSCAHRLDGERLDNPDCRLHGRDSIHAEEYGDG
jgi:hypothetical protein